MKYNIVLDPQAIDDLLGIRVYDRRKIVDAMNRILAATPAQISRSRIKRLRGMGSPQYRLRVDEFRVFYDIIADDVHVMRVLSKQVAEQYLKEMRRASEDD